MGLIFHSHQPEFVIDEETWDAFLRKAEARQETVGELVAYAIELFMEREGFSPAWAEQPTGIALAPGARRRRAPRRREGGASRLDSKS